MAPFFVVIKVCPRGAGRDGQCRAASPEPILHLSATVGLICRFEGCWSEPQKVREVPFGQILGRYLTIYWSCNALAEATIRPNGFRLPKCVRRPRTHSHHWSHSTTLS